RPLPRHLCLRLVRRQASDAEGRCARRRQSQGDSPVNSHIIAAVLAHAGSGDLTAIWNQALVAGRALGGFIAAAALLVAFIARTTLGAIILAIAVLLGLYRV